MNLKYWKQFETSGKIEDYLSFVSGERQEMGEESQTGESGHAGVYMGDGYDIEAVPGGGVRQTYQPFN